MGLLNWLWENWFSLVQSAGIVGGLIYTARVVRTDDKVRRVENLFALTKQHREIWSLLYEHPGISRVTDPNADPVKEPVTREEDLFVTFLILHLGTLFRAATEGFYVTPEGLTSDVRGFFSLPIPKAVWTRVAPLQDRAFVDFVGKALAD